MSIATRIENYLHERNIPYQSVHHYHSNSSIGTAVAAQVPLHQIAKAVLLRDHQDRLLMAVLPADSKISLSALNDELRGSFKLLKESEVYQLFKDCDHGAVPPFGSAYNMTMVCDSQLDRLDSVYMEGGDHKTLLKIEHDRFEQLMADGKHLRFSRQIFH